MEKKMFQLDKKEICITSTQIKQAIDLLVNENEILQDREFELQDRIDKALHKLRASKNHFKTERENNTITFVIRILKGSDK